MALCYLCAKGEGQHPSVQDWHSVRERSGEWGINQRLSAGEGKEEEYFASFLKWQFSILVAMLILKKP